MKKTLLIAAAALVAGIVSSEAQVYSANVVGYVNVFYPQGTNVFVATPLTTGNDVITNVIIKPPGGTQIQLWNAVSGSFNTITYSGPASNRHWTDTSAVNQDNALIAPGIGYFVSSGLPFTNTYVGNIVAATGSSVTNALTSGVATAAGELVPFGDYVTNSLSVNLIPPGGTQIQLFDSVHQTFSVYTYSGPASNRQWHDTLNNIVYPQLSPGQGFFINAGLNYNWAQTLP